MGTSANPPTNTAYVPSDADRDFMKVHHRIGWHPEGGWCRKLTGDANRTYFGKVPPAEAVRKLERELKARSGEGEPDYTNVTIRQAVNLFLANADAELASGNIGKAQRASYGDELIRFARKIGINRRLADLCRADAPERFFRPARDAAMKRGVYAAEKYITQVRTFLHWCNGVRRIMGAPNYAGAFYPPTEKEKKLATKKARKGKKMAYFTANEVQQILDAAKADNVHVYAQLLLMLNGGMGAGDLSELEDADVDWDRRCIHTDRSKTLVPRCVPLWDKTIDAMKASRAARATPLRAEWADRFFLSKRRMPLVTETMNADGDRSNRKDTIKNWFYRLTRADKPKEKDAPRLPDLLKGKHRAGVYTFRAVFQTLAADQPSDLVAVVMGHKFAVRVKEHYLRGDLREKLVAVTEHVRFQLWPEERPANRSGTAASSA
jgi:integrase